uniref:Uncharacterized protein n=1 Tax=Rhizophora mucronata TaxID=61149 RepID=A0A2P2IP65_RHIMU
MDNWNFTTLISKKHHLECIYIMEKKKHLNNKICKNFPSARKLLCSQCSQ